MSYINLSNFNEFVIKSYISEDYICIDGTCGNGHDLLKIKQQLNDTGKVFAFDIQSSALENAKKMIIDNSYSVENIEFIKDSHENLDMYVAGEIDFAIYNLGYLPGSNKSITTIWESTKISLNKILKLIKVGGLVSITAYPGHQEGYEERNELREYLLSLDNKIFNISNMRYFNQKDTAPETFIIEKRK